MPDLGRETTALSAELIAAAHAYFMEDNAEGCIHFDKGYGPYAMCEDPGQTVPLRAVSFLAACSPSEPGLRTAAQFADTVICVLNENGWSVYHSKTVSWVDRRRVAAALRAALSQPAGTEDGATRIANERRRQIEKEGWTAYHDDDMHDGPSLALAAVCYALPPDHEARRPQGGYVDRVPPLWPWDEEWWKPVATPNDPKLGRIRELEKAGALIAAEIDRLLRAAQPRQEVLSE
jgi:hypothetical protein